MTLSLRTVWGRAARPAPAPKTLFFCRGRGRGHAVPDLLIADELRRVAPELEPRFVSYGTGAATLAEGGAAVRDLQMREDAPFLDLLIAATRVIDEERPDVVVSHEEFAALAAAKAFRRPTALIVDFFPPPDHVWAQTLPHADEILFIERRGLFAEPPAVRGRVVYAGPIVRPLARTRADRGLARRELGLAESATVLSVIPGSWATEEKSPALELVLAAFERLRAPDKMLVWVAGRDFAVLSDRLRAVPGVRVLEGCRPIETLMVASDLVLTKANRGTTLELGNLGVPSISLSHGLNPIDETIIPRIASNVALNARGIDPAFLAETMERTIAASRVAPPLPAALGGGETVVAEKIAAFAHAHATASA
jgi:hypothetical protein